MPAPLLAIIEKLNGTVPSWRTSVFGILAGLLLVIPEIQTLFDEDATTVPDYNVVLAGVALALGLSSARDNKVTSEKAGAA